MFSNVAFIEKDSELYT